MKKLLFHSAIIIAFSTTAALVFNTLGGIPVIQDSRQKVDYQISESLPESEGVHFVNFDAAQRFIDGRMGPVLDARSPEEYNRGHLPGAQNCFFYELEQYLPRLLADINPESPLLIYCIGEDCEDSRFLAESLKDTGFSRLYVFKGGFEQWQEAGLPVESGSGLVTGSAEKTFSIKKLVDFSVLLPSWFWLLADFFLFFYGLYFLLLLKKKGVDISAVLIAARVVGVIFVIASLHKIASPLQFARIMDNYQILSPVLVNPAAIVMPWIEIISGAFLLGGLLRRPASLVLLGLTGVFILAVGFNIVRGLEFDCGCFGGSHIPAWQVLIRDFGLFCLILPNVLRRE